MQRPHQRSIRGNPARFAGLAALAIAPLLTSSASAATKYWDNDGGTAGLQAGNGTWDTGTTSLWSTTVSGSALTTWADNDDAFFYTQNNSTNLVTLSGSILANSISAGLSSGTASSTTLLGSGSLALGSTTNGLNVTSNSTLTINTGVSLGGATQTWNPSGTVIVNGALSGTTALTLSGPGRAFFNGSSSLTSLTTSASSGSPILLTLAGPATLTGGLVASGVGGRIFSGSDNNVGFVSAGSFMMLGGSNTIGAGGTTITSTLVISSDANIGGTGSLLRFGTNGGTLRILGTTLNTFGARSVINSTTGGDSPNMDIADAANTFTFNKAIVASGSNVLALGSTNSFIKSGAGTLILNQANTTTGTFNARGGTMVLDAAGGGSVVATSKLALSGGIFSLLGPNTGTLTQTMGTVTDNAAGGTIRVNGGSSTSTTLALGTVTFAANGPVNFQTVGSNSFIQIANAVDSTGIYSARAVYNGSDWAAQVSGNVGAYSGYSTLATAAGTDTLNSQVTAGAALSAGAHTTNTLKIANTASGTLDLGGGQLSLTGGGLLFAGTADYSVSNGSLSATTTNDLIVYSDSSSTLTIGATVTNNGATVTTLTKGGSGKLILSTNNTYTGETWVTGGTLSGADFSGTASIFGGASASTAVNVNGGALEYTGATDSTSRGLAIGSNGAIIDIVSSSAVFTWSGTISNISGNNGSLTKNGAGTLLLTTASNSFTGGVFINAGVLQLGATSSLNGNSPNIVTFGSGSTGTLRLGGQSIMVGGLRTSATVGTPVVENASATAASLQVSSTFAETFAGVMQNGTGAGALSLIKQGGNTFTLTGANTYSGGTTINAGTLAVSGSGRLGTGNVLVNPDGKLSINTTSDLAIADTATLTLASGGSIDIDGSESVAVLNLGSTTFALSTVFNLANNYQGYGNSAGSFFAGSTGSLTVVPEPGSLSLLGLAAAGLLARRRRR